MWSVIRATYWQYTENAILSFSIYTRGIKLIQLINSLHTIHNIAILFVFRIVSIKTQFHLRYILFKLFATFYCHNNHNIYEKFNFCSSRMRLNLTNDIQNGNNVWNMQMTCHMKEKWINKHWYIWNRYAASDCYRTISYSDWHEQRSEDDNNLWLLFLWN